MPEGPGLYLLRLLPRIHLQTCRSSTSYMFRQSQHLQKRRQKNGGLGTMFHHDDFPLLPPELTALCLQTGLASSGVIHNLFLRMLHVN